MISALLTRCVEKWQPNNDVNVLAARRQSSWVLLSAQIAKNDVLLVPFIILQQKNVRQIRFCKLSAKKQLAFKPMSTSSVLCCV
jgi:hypothetical protein